MGADGIQLSWTAVGAIGVGVIALAGWLQSTRTKVGEATASIKSIEGMLTHIEGGFREWRDEVREDQSKLWTAHAASEREIGVLKTEVAVMKNQRGL